MPAQARQIPLTDEDLAASGGGLYATMEVPADYEVTLVDVDDYKTVKSQGWVFSYDVELETGTVGFKVFLSFSTKARWKIIEVLEAHDVNLELGLNDVDPNAFIGDVVGAWIDFPRDKDKVPTSRFREIRRIYPLIVQEMEIPGPAEGVDATPAASTWEDEGGAILPTTPDDEAPF